MSRVRTPGKSLPDFIEPMLVLLTQPFDSDQHLYEIKWDGFRSLCFVDGSGQRLVGRRTTDFTTRFPELDVLAKLPKGTVLDGEIVALKADGTPDFAALLSRERSWPGRLSKPAPGRSPRHPPVTFVAFDLLYEKYQPIMDRPLLERRERLERVLARTLGPRLAFSEGVVGGGLGFVNRVAAMGLEGAVAKRIDSPYEPGVRTGTWMKFKRRQTLIGVIIGYLPNTTGGLKSVLLAADVEGELRFVGQVGSGIDQAIAERLMRLFKGREQPQPVVECPIPKSRWLFPDLCCRVSFAEWTDGGKLRAPVFESLYEA